MPLPGFRRFLRFERQGAQLVDSGSKTRSTFYNLYHILNHLNLFGSGYLGQAESMVEQLLSQCKS